MKKESKTSLVINYLKTGKTITSYEAWERWNVTRLASIINIARNKKHMNIVSERIFRNGTNWSVYWLEDEGMLEGDAND